MVIPAILGLGKALPSYFKTQSEIASLLCEVMQLRDEEAWILEKIYKNSAISQRYYLLMDSHDPQIHFCPDPKKIRTLLMSERNEIYKKEAPLLAEKAARNALHSWKRERESITHV